MSMEIDEFTTQQGVLPNLRVANKAQALRELARRAAAATGHDEQAILTALLDRERLGSTGIGKHVALPHARIAGLPRIFGFFARLERPIDFEAIDEKPVDLIFMLLAPEDSGKDHLAALARISRLFRDPAVCSRLRHAENAAVIHEILSEPGGTPS
jgi:PTS system nitrogen regulatory IIA component